MKKTALLCAVLLGLSACGSAYITPSVDEFNNTDADVRVVRMTRESVLVANRSKYSPASLPGVFYANAGTGSGALRGAGALPQIAGTPQTRPNTLETRLPPSAPEAPYRIGVGDVVLLATPQSGSTVEELTGLLAATNRRQGYTVQDDGAIAIPDVGRVMVAGQTLEEAEAVVFEALVQNQINPTFSLEVAEFNSQRVSVGGAVRNPTVVPVQLTPLYLDEALAAAGGVSLSDQEFASIRLYRDGSLYQIPVKDLYSRRALQRIRLADGDSLFVDTDFELDKAEAYFEQQIRLQEFRQRSRTQALNELQTEVSLRRAALEESRQNFRDQIDFDAVNRDYVYLTGEVTKPSRFVMPFNQRPTLADALYGEGGFSVETANVSQIYVLRQAPNPADFGAVTAWHLDARNAVNFVLATDFELRPNDVIFIAEQPITRWNRVLQQFIPSLITTTVGAAVSN